MEKNKGQILPILTFLISISLGIGFIFSAIKFDPEKSYLPQIFLSYPDGGKFVNISGCGIRDYDSPPSCHDGDYCNLDTMTCNVPSGGSVYSFICNTMNDKKECGNVANGGATPIDGSKNLPNEGPLAVTQEDLNVCGRWIQLDVFDKDCNPNNDGNWTCGTPEDYFVYYTGDCQCNDIELQVYNKTEALRGQPIMPGNEVRLKIIGRANLYIRDEISGPEGGIICPWDGEKLDYDWEDDPTTGGKVEGDCQAVLPGTYTWTHYWKECEDGTDSCSGECSESIEFIIEGEEEENKAAVSGRLYCQDIGGVSYPIGGIQVELYNSLTNQTIYTTTNESGNYNFLPTDPNTPNIGDIVTVRISQDNLDGSLSNGKSYSEMNWPPSSNCANDGITGCTYNALNDGHCGTSSYEHCGLQYVSHSNFDFKFTNCEPESNPLVCQYLSIDNGNINDYISRGETLRFSCVGEGDNIDYARFRILNNQDVEIVSSEGNNVFESTSSATINRMFIWDYTVPEEIDDLDVGTYKAQCQICDTDNQCTNWTDTN